MPISTKSLAIVAAATLASVTSATPVSRRQEDVSNASDWAPILNGDEGASCAELAVIFARGTFDPGNVGPWVGGPWRDDLKANHNSVAFQGVSTQAYAANLPGYIEEGGPKQAASALASDVRAYSKACPDADIVISGWSQGALVARKSLGELGGAADKVVAFVTFGDPVSLWTDTQDFPAVPSQAEELSYCQTTTPDPLCTRPLSGFPKRPSQFIQRLSDIWGEVNENQVETWEQKRALLSIVKELPKQATRQIDTLARDLLAGRMGRWMLTPQHFWYGIDGSVQAATDDVLAVIKA